MNRTLKETIEAYENWDLYIWPYIPTIKYKYKRFGKWYEGERRWTKESIEKYEMVPIVILNDNEEDEFI